VSRSISVWSTWEHAPLYPAVPRHPTPAVYKWRRCRERPKLYLFGQLNGSPKSGLIPAWSAKVVPIRPFDVPRTGRYGLRTHHRWYHPRFRSQRPIKAVLDPYNPPAPQSTQFHHIEKESLADGTRAGCTSTGVILTVTGKPSSARVAESHPRVRVYIKNHNLGLEVPYRYGSETRKYLPDFIVLVDDGHGDDDLLHLIVRTRAPAETPRRKRPLWKPTGYWCESSRHTWRWPF